MVASYTLLIVSLICVVHGLFDVPQVNIIAYWPSGLEVSIPDVSGIKSFAFHANINDGDRSIAGTVVQSENDEWTYYDNDIVLSVGDVLYFSVNVNYDDGSGDVTTYQKLEQSFTIAELEENVESLSGLPPGQRKKLAKNRNKHARDNDPDNQANRVTTTTTTTTTEAPTTTTEATTTKKAPLTCIKSGTTIGTGKLVCKDRLIFEDNFNMLMKRRWEIEDKFAGDPDYEFVLYENDPYNVRVENNQLFIKPRLFDEKYGVGACLEQKDFDLGISCTGVTGTLDCSQKPQAFIILPPVLSGRISTRQSFSFRYGTIEIRAKLPKGDWIYPELFLTPKAHKYGFAHKSGEIRIGLLHGNSDMRHKLNGGVILGSSDAARTYAMYSINSETDWSDDFHIFTVKWLPKRILISVDGKMYGNITAGYASLASQLSLEGADLWKEGTPFAPFDQQMYITLGVGVGGHSFSDTIENKPYKNKDPKNQRIFYQMKDKWHATWNADSQLIVDYVKVYSI